MLAAPTRAAAVVWAGFSTTGSSGGAAGGGANVGRASPDAETMMAVAPLAAGCDSSVLRGADSGSGSVGSAGPALSRLASAGEGVGREAVAALLGTGVSAVSGRGAGSAPDPLASAWSGRIFFRRRRAGRGGCVSVDDRFCGVPCADPVGGSHVGVAL